MDAKTFRDTADDFTKAYVECALWSSSAELGDCEKCGEERVSTDPSTERHSCGGRVSGTDCSFTDLAFDIENIAPETLDAIVADCTRFQAENEELITEENSLRYGPDCHSASARAGHDFWLTRNGHGAGFWDGDWEEATGIVLTKASERFGEVSLYLGDDQLIYQ